MNGNQPVILEAVGDFDVRGSAVLRNAFSFTRGTRFLLQPSSGQVSEWLCVQLLNDPGRIGYVPVSYVRVASQSHFEPYSSRSGSMRSRNSELQLPSRFPPDSDVPLTDDQLPPRDYETEVESSNARSIYERSRALYESSAPLRFSATPALVNNVLTQKPPELRAIKSALNRELSLEARLGFPSVRPRNELDEALEKMERRKQGTDEVDHGNAGSSALYYNDEFRAALRQRAERLEQIEEAESAGNARRRLVQSTFN